jgi:hypothetical protein
MAAMFLYRFNLVYRIEIGLEISSRGETLICPPIPDVKACWGKREVFLFEKMLRGEAALS